MTKSDGLVYAITLSAMDRNIHIHDELLLAKTLENSERFTVTTRFGPVEGGKASNGSIVFLEIPYAEPPKRFEDPKPLPDSFRYPNKDYISESNCFDSLNLPDCRLFLNIYIPPSFQERLGYPVKVYIHGGFLQFGSPHTLGSQAQFIVKERPEIWVNIGYRLSAFGFLASARHGLTGNYGFKDQWLALEWIKQNISAFGGDPEDIQVTGLSAGAHSVHQLLHRVSILPEGVNAPFTSAVLQSNAILADPKTPSELEPQFEALCQALSLDPDSPNVVSDLKNPFKMPGSAITKVIENEKLGRHGTFRGCLSDDWIISSPGPMERQRNGSFAKSLQDHGVRYIVLGEVSEEWYLYSIAHTISSPADFAPNLERYFSSELVEKLLSQYPPLPPTATKEDIVKRFGDMLGCVQVYLPLRVLAQDLRKASFPFLRYQICWTPEQDRPLGYVTHGTDRSLWAFRLPFLTDEQVEIARDWLNRVASEAEKLIDGSSRAPELEQVFCLRKDGIGWETDERWEELAKLGTSILSESG
ncbi:Alpha/Beta hydrolase protein [Coprinopsis sp. MPI-PUGE-AT-0042]|nr:Alpha/Beta hydrolase protein [Coprinopsis sp. MPI-PUGE-AT-0042]